MVLIFICESDKVCYVVLSGQARCMWQGTVSEVLVPSDSDVCNGPKCGHCYLMRWLCLAEV
jgi:hypothetical protein